MQKLFSVIVILVINTFLQALQAQGLALQNAKIYPAPGADFILNGTLIINNGKITAIGSSKNIRIPAGSTIIDCKGMIITPAFWNSHVHFIEPQWQGAATLPAERLYRQLTAMLTRYGFAYVWDLASLDFANLTALRNRVNSGEVAGPRIFAVGEPFAPPHGSPFYIAPLTLPEIGDPDSASAYVSKQLSAGADGIKLWTASPAHHTVINMPGPVSEAAVATAHQAGKPVFSHPTNNEGVEIAVKTGVDNLSHVAPDDGKPWRKELIDSMLKKNMALIPTLKLFKWELERANIAAQSHPLLLMAQQQLAQYAKAGGIVLFGTDVGYVTDYSPTDEYVLMQESGLSFQQIFASLTSVPARRFGMEATTGKLAVGMQADIVVLAGDPAQDIRALSNVMYTIRNGVILFNKKKDLPQ